MKEQNNNHNEEELLEAVQIKTFNRISELFIDAGLIFPKELEEVRWFDVTLENNHQIRIIGMKWSNTPISGFQTSEKFQRYEVACDSETEYRLGFDLKRFPNSRPWIIFQKGVKEDIDISITWKPKYIEELGYLTEDEFVQSFVAADALNKLNKIISLTPVSYGTFVAIPDIPLTDNDPTSIYGFNVVGKSRIIYTTRPIPK